MINDYSIWLVPEKGTREYRNLKEMIEGYSESIKDAPSFDPHVTVVGGVDRNKDEMQRITEKLADSNSAMAISLVKPHISTTRYQCFFLLAEPTIELLELHDQARELCGQEQSMYVPHLSLVYSDIPINERRELGEEFESGSLQITFTASELELWDTSGPVEEWEKVEDFEL